MNRFVLSAVALTTLVGSSAATPTGGSSDWTSLDREIESLSNSLQATEAPKQEGFKVGGYIKTQFDSSKDFQSGGNDLGGFGFSNIRIILDGQVGDYKLKITAEGASGTFAVSDAYVRFPVHENINVQMGQFKSRFLYSYYVSDEKMLFYNRSAIANAWGSRDTGLQVDGTFGPFIGILQLQNGGDGAGNEFALTAKAIYAALGKPILNQAGGFGPDAETALTMGAGYFDDSSVTDSDAIEAEAIFTHGGWYATAEVVDHGDGFGGIGSGVAKNVDYTTPTATTPPIPYTTTNFAGLTPWNAALAYQFTEHWQVAAEFQDDDDSANTTRIRGGLNYYINGNNTKWQLNYSTAASDVAANEVDLLTLGLVVAI